jgi:putative oxidoreductase
MNQTKDVAALLGRVLLAFMFVTAGYGKVGSFEGTTAYIASAHLPLPPVATAIAIVVELVGGLMVVVGWKTRWAALAMAVFTIVATVAFHNFWTMADAAEAGTNKLMFLKNVSVIGGYLVLYAFGPGRYSVDRG